ncbi:hypothetical protein IPA41_002065 [Escherichia coli]|nr:hypothetical protein [Escherichia coli]
MTVVITYLADDNARNRRRARRQAQREQAMQEQRLARKIALKLSGCVRADKAASLGILRCKKADVRCKKADECSGSICLPNVALYAAGYRKSKQLTAR